MAESLAALPGVHPFPSDANYILVRFEGVDAGELWQQLLDRGILVRDFSRSASLENCLRISIGTAEQNEAVIAALKELLDK